MTRPAEMGVGPVAIDLALTDPRLIVHAVADTLAGRCVKLTWASNTNWPNERSGDDDAFGVHGAVVEVIGCVAAPDLPVNIGCLRADDDEYVGIAWNDLLHVGRCLGGDVPYTIRKQLIEVSRWFGHSIEFTTRDDPDGSSGPSPASNAP